MPQEERENENTPPPQFTIGEYGLSLKVKVEILRIKLM